MSKLNTDQLTVLLRANLDFPFAVRCLDILSSGEQVGASVTLGARENLIKIYDLRARMDAKKADQTTGYEIFLRNLKESNAQDVQANIIRSDDRNLIVFSDTDFKILLGILSAPSQPNKEGFFVPG